MIGTRIGIAEVSIGERRGDTRRMLVERRRALQNEIQSRVRVVRQEGSAKQYQTTAVGETSEVEPEDDLAFALIQLKAEELERVNEAVRRLDAGSYGHCVDCGELIASSRLRAMPFAVRCKDCEQMREYSQHRGRIQLPRLSSEAGLR
jgi:DnaK suppressor protein